MVAGGWFVCACVGGGGPRVSNFFYYGSKFKIKKNNFLWRAGMGAGGGGDPNLKKIGGVRGDGGRGR